MHLLPHPRLVRPALVIAALLVGSVPVSSAARAEPGPSAAALAKARALFKEARRLEDAGKWGAALERFQRIAEVRMTPQVRFHLALCSENVGHWTQALDGYALAAREAAGTAPDVVAEAEQHLRALTESLPTVTLRAPSAAPGDELSLDHRPIPFDAAPLAIRLDPGPHSAELRRGGALLARELFTLEPRATLQIELRAESPVALEPPEAAAAPSSVVPPPAAPPPAAQPSEPPPPAPSPPSGTTKVLGWAAIGLGTASAMATGVFLALRSGALDELDMACPSHTHCDASVEPIVHRGTLDAALVNVFGVLALASVVTGTALVVTSPAASPPAKAKRVTVSLTPVLGAGTAGLLVGGRF